jgi:hypothetical protein
MYRVLTYTGPWSYGSWIYNYLCNQCLSPLMLWVRISIRARCTTLLFHVSLNCTMLYYLLHISEMFIYICKVLNRRLFFVISKQFIILCMLIVCLMVFNTTYNNISVILWRWHVGGFIRVLRFPPLIKLTATI